MVRLIGVADMIILPPSSFLVPFPCSVVPQPHTCLFAGERGGTTPVTYVNVTTTIPVSQRNDVDIRLCLERLIDYYIAALNIRFYR